MIDKKALMGMILDYGDAIKEGAGVKEQLAHLENIRDQLGEWEREMDLADSHRDTAHFLPGHRR